MRTILIVVMILGVSACGKKKSEPQADQPPTAPAVESTGAAPAAPPTTGAIAGQKYKMNVRLGEQTAPPTLSPKKDDATAPVADSPADPAAPPAEAAARKADAAKAAAAKAAREATQPR